MEVLVFYDVATETAVGRRRLRRVAQICLDYGQRVQKSVFECSINEMQYEQLRDRLLKCIDTEEDNLRIYRLIFFLARCSQELSVAPVLWDDDDLRICRHTGCLDRSG
jgi:CRISPR-associated protein Cas2